MKRKIKQLFCWHIWEEICTGYLMKIGPFGSRVPFPTYDENKLQCSKCGKYKFIKNEAIK
jgi:hypothetical protein